MRAARLLLILAALPAIAQAAGSDCADIEDPLAYNACLASRGPKAALGGPPGRDAPSQIGGPARTPVRAQPTRRFIPRHGRAHMEFQVK